MIWAHVQRGTINTNYTPDLIKWEEAPQTVRVQPQAVVPSATLTPRAKTADGPPRLKQRAIAPARLGHSIRIDKTGLEDGQRSSTRRQVLEPGWWSFTASGPRRSERPMTGDVSARARHRLERSDAWKSATAGESWRTRTDTELSEPLEVSPLQTHAALQTKAFTKAFMGLNERRLTSKEPERAVAPARPVPMSQMKLATTLERLSAPSKRRGRQNVQDTRPEQSPEEIQLEIQKKKLKEHTIRRVIAGDGYQEYEGESRLPADRQSTYVMDELTGRELTGAEKNSIMAIFREMVKSSGALEGRDQKPEEEMMRGTTGAVISWSEVAKSLRGRLSNAHVQRLGIYFGLKGLKGKIRYKLYEERIGLMVTASPEKRLRIAFGLLDVGGDGVLGRRDVFAALSSTTFEEPGSPKRVTVVFTAPGAYGIHFETSDTPSMLVLDVVHESPAHSQGVRPGSRLCRINGMNVDRLTLAEVRALLMNPARPMSMTFQSKPQEPAETGHGIFDPKDLNRLLDALRMDFVTRRVKILVMGAKNLKSPDQHFINSNPYCQVEVEGKPRTRWQTKSLQENLDPEWKEEREIADFAIGGTLKFTVRDKDFGTKEDDILGIATLASGRFQASGFEGELPLFDESGRQKMNSHLTVRVMLSGEGGIGLTDFEKVFHEGEPSFLRHLQEVMTGCTSKRNEHIAQHVKIQVSFISATGLRHADAAAYVTCESYHKAKYERIRPKGFSESIDLVAIGGEKPHSVDYMPGEGLRLAVYDGPKAESSELLGSCVVECGKFWPAGFEGPVQLSEEQSRREKKSNVVLKIKVTTPDSMLPHQFAAQKREPGTNAQERFEAEMKELRARMPFLTATDFTWHTRVFEALRDEDWLIQRSRLITSADKIFGIPLGHIAGRLFESVSPKRQPVGVLDWAQFLQRHRGNDWEAQQERVRLTFELYDLDGDGFLSLADAINLSDEVVRLEKIYGEESAGIPVCEEMRWLYGLIANAADGGRDGGRLDLQVFKQLRPTPSLMQAMLKCLDSLVAPERPERRKVPPINTKA